MNSFGMLAATLAVCVPAIASAENCLRGEVTFRTAGIEQVVVLQIFEQRLEVPSALSKVDETARIDGALTVYPEARKSRSLANANAFAVDMLTFDASGHVLNMQEDTTGKEVDFMASGDGLLFATRLTGGAIRELGLDRSTQMTGWSCIEAE